MLASLLLHCAIDVTPPTLQASFGKGAAPPAASAPPIGQPLPSAADATARSDFAPAGAAGSAEDHWRQHSAAVAACPVSARPSLVLAPGEAVVRVSFSGSDGGSAADGWLHDEAAEQWQAAQEGRAAGAAPATTAAAAGSTKPLGGLFKPLRKLGAPPGAGTVSATGSTASSDAGPAARILKATARVAPSLTLPAAIAQGGPLLSVLTTHRLLVLTPALQILAALPAVVPVAGSFGGGLGGVPSQPPGMGGGGGIAGAALACASYGVWLGAYGAATGAGVPVRAGAGAGAAGVGLAAEDAEAYSTALALAQGGAVAPASDPLPLGGSYVGHADAVAAIGGIGGPSRPPSSALGPVARAAGAATLALFPPPWPAASPLFGAPTAGLSPVDTSTSFQARAQSCTCALLL